jgi:hypothetical protein
VDNILQKCRTLPEAVDKPLILGNTELKEWLYTSTAFLDGEDMKPLQSKLRDLAAKALGGSSTCRAVPRQNIEQFIGRIRRIDVLRGAWAWDKPEAARQREALLEDRHLEDPSESLERLTVGIENLAKDYKEDLLKKVTGDDNEDSHDDYDENQELSRASGSMETYRPNESLGQSWGPDASSGFSAPAYSKAGKATVHRSQGEGWSSSSSSGAGLTRNQLVENVKRKFQQLDRRCDFLQDDLCRLVSQEFDGGRPLNDVNVLVDQIFHESKEIPKLIEKMTFLLDLSPESHDVDEKIRDKLLPSNSLSDLLAKLKRIISGKRG